MIDTATNAVAATIAVGLCPQEVAVAPDGKHAYVTNSCSNSVSVIDTAANAVSATIGAVASPFSVAVAPDGKHAYVTSPFGTVSVIDAAANVVSATIRVGAYALDIAVAQAAGIPFTAFSAKLDIAFGSLPNQDSFELKSSFTLSSASNGINPLTDPVTLKVGSFSVTIPTGSFTSNKKGFYHFDGVIGGVSLQVLIKPTATLQYVFKAEATGVNLTGTPNPVSVTLTIGNNTGTVSINAGS